MRPFGTKYWLGRPDAAGKRRASFAPAKPLPRWKQADLIRPVCNALDVAHQVVDALDGAATPFAVSDGQEAGTAGRIREKVVSETAMLLLSVDSIPDLDPQIRERANALAQRLVPYARHADVLAGICVEPGLARDHAVAHAILSHLGLPDPHVDELLSLSMAMAPDFGPERLPYQRLEQAWLGRVWDVIALPGGHDSQLVADSMLGRPMDALGSTRLDIYAFTHAVMYASDLGRRRVARPRPKAAIAADAAAALAYSLDVNDHDLTAEVLMTWPMLGLAWEPVAILALEILMRVEAELGFLPGLRFDYTRYQALRGNAQLQFVLSTSYHSSYVMGFLCAATLAHEQMPPVTVPAARCQMHGAAAALLRLIDVQDPTPCWSAPLRALARDRQDAVAPFLLGVVLRRARGKGSVRLVQQALEVALAYDLIDAPAPSQAVALLCRCQALRLVIET